MGSTHEQVSTTPGHTAGHLRLWQPAEGLLVVGDALSDYHVGCVNLAPDGPMPRPPLVPPFAGVTTASEVAWLLSLPERGWSAR